jgi:hypothetical protein
MSYEVLNVLWKMWKSGPGTPSYATTVTVHQLEAKDRAMVANGMRLENLSVKNGHYFAVWQPGTGGQHWQSGMSEAKFKQVSHEQAEAGRRLHCVSLDSGELAAVWRDGTGTQQWQIGLPHDDFKNVDDKWAEQGLRIHSISVDGGLIACCWRPGSGKYRWIANTSQAELRKTDTACTKEGLAMVQLAVDDDGLFNLNGNWIAVWSSPMAPTAWGIALGTSDFNQYITKMAAERSFLPIAIAGWQTQIGGDETQGSAHGSRIPGVDPDTILNDLVIHDG